MFKPTFILLAFITIGCADDVKPKPRRFAFRISSAEILPFNNNCAYTFEYSDFAKIYDAKSLVGTIWLILR
jgi:hypothetical protein